jgi:2',3'-cyclic-nucleotide 2'-phosphodiesterase (5'-nucleotidase family)
MFGSLFHRLNRNVQIVGVGLLLASVGSEAFAQSARLTFLHSNDMGEIGAKPGYGGFPELATLIKRERERSPSAITTFGGDLISPSLMSGLSHGVEMISMMNAVKMDVAVLGNHEFDFGPAITRERIAQSNFPWLASNITLKPSEAPLGSKKLYVKKVGDFTVGFFGLLTQETIDLSSPGEGILFDDVIETAKKSIAELKAQGADIIVALTHLDYQNDLRLAREVKGITLILGGHDHRAIAGTEGRTVILQAGSDLRYLGVVDLEIARKEKRGKKYLSVVPSWKLLATAGVPADAEIKSAVAAFEKTLDKKLDIAVGKTDVALDTKRASVRTKQTIFGGFIAKAMRHEVNADVGFTNGGGIRGDREYKEGTVLTRKDILKELPFGNVTVSLKVTGAQLTELVEHSVSKVEDAAGRFGHYAGLSYRYDVTKAVGSRVQNIDVNGQPIDAVKVYVLATNDYVAKGGDGYAMLKAVPRIVDKSAGTLMATTVMNYLEAQGAITAAE